MGGDLESVKARLLDRRTNGGGFVFGKATGDDDVDHVELYVYAGGEDGELRKDLKEDLGVMSTSSRSGRSLIQTVSSVGGCWSSDDLCGRVNTVLSRRSRVRRLPEFGKMDGCRSSVFSYSTTERCLGAS